MKHKTYTRIYEFGRIQLYGKCEVAPTNPNGLGVCLILSGEGCDQLTKILTGKGKELVDFFRECENYYEGSYHFTRLDIAIDDKNIVPYFTIEQLYKKCKKEEYISNARSHSLRESTTKDIISKTLYIGTRTSDMLIRFYDKDKEQFLKFGGEISNMRSWKRTEMELHDKLAHAFVKELIQSELALGKLACMYLGGKLRFIIPDNTQKNKSRWSTSRFWERFLGDVQTLKINIDRGESSIYQTELWLINRGVYSAIKAFKLLEKHNALGGLRSPQTCIIDAKFSPELAQKVVTHLRMIDRADIIPYIYKDTKQISEEV
jgi:Putative phage replication protein RstA